MQVCSWHSLHMAWSIHSRFTSKPDHYVTALLTLSRLNQRKRHLGVKAPQRWPSAQSRSPHLGEILDDPDSRSMATSRRGSAVVGYNVQVAVDTEGSGID